MRSFVLTKAGDGVPNTNKMKNLEIQKMQRVEVPAEYQEEEGCVAFQLVKFSFCFFGKKIEDTLDTKIMSDGRQLVIGGNSFIKANFEINRMSL